ncbi:unnamed protein product [Staurois parvus]|uniref:PQ-loop repeat-containing protein 2 n=1 Tax=Staurois parvus TaxID=386267 RepID=A0ABN9C7I8_9NEOB|nr:unnamed protein product [Staurois parvus]
MYGWRRFSGLEAPSPPRNFSDCPNGTLRSEWVWNIFNECASDGRDVASVILGLVSILCFIFSSFPQYYKSCKTGNMDKALSIWFLLGWLAGDSCNFVGAFLSNQLPIQVYTAIYYVVADVLMLVLYIYYKYRNQRTAGASLIVNAICGFALIGSSAALFQLGDPGLSATNYHSSPGGRRLLAADDSDAEPFSTQEIIGCVVGSVSSMFYLASRLPQIITNFRRRSTEGLLSLSLLYGDFGELDLRAQHPPEEPRQGAVRNGLYQASPALADRESWGHEPGLHYYHPVFRVWCETVKRQ